MLVVLGLIVAYRLLSHIPVPLAEPTQLKDVLANVLTSTDLGGFLNILTGGALANLSIVLVGLSPYITASIVTQLLTKAIPKLEEMQKEGETSRRKIQQWTRIITLPLAVLQSIAFIFILRQTILAGNTGTDIVANTSPLQWVVMITAMTAGAMLLMWFGELITEQGVGNGMSLLIFAGIVSQLPQTLGTLGASLTSIASDSDKLNVFNWFTLPINAIAFWVTLAIVLTSLVGIYLIVKINEAQRIVTINYAKRVQGNRHYGGITSILPIKLISAGVIPVIFAVAFLALPAFVGQLLISAGNEKWQNLGSTLVAWFQTPNAQAFALAGDLTALIYPSLYLILVVLFTYFYTSIVFNSHEIAENLQKQGGFVANVRPGIQTEKYLSRIVNRLTLFGSLALGVIAITPFVFEFVGAKFGLQLQNLALGGTSLLLVVSITLETLRQINSRALMVTYDQDY